jgi:hypothetical protein
MANQDRDIVVSTTQRFNVVSLGQVTKNTNAETHVLSPSVPAPVALAALLSSRTPGHETWWSLHAWDGSRSKAKWKSAAGFVVDIDYINEEGQHVAPDISLRSMLLTLALDGRLDANLYHDTPRGVRLVYWLDSPLTDSIQFRAAATENANFVQAKLEEYKLGTAVRGFTVDMKVQTDTARMVFAPNSVVNGHAREAEVIVLEETPSSLWRWYRTSSFSEAAEAFNHDNQHIADEWPRASGTCPVCEHNKCFGYLPENPTRWVCFSANHTKGVGLEKDGLHVGDVLDIVSHQIGKSRLETLMEAGYLAKNGAITPAKGSKSEVVSPRSGGDAGIADEANLSVEDVTEIEDMLEHCIVIDGTTTVFDLVSKNIYRLDAFKLRYPRTFGVWNKHPARKILRGEAIRFAPGGVREGEENLFEGMPLRPDSKKSCDLIVKHLFVMCGQDADLTHDLTCWLAWPLQHPGEKIGYSYVFHGRQGTGKSLFFEKLMMQVYGNYAIQIGQHELESKYTGWLSKKLYVVCNEVSSFAADRKATKNRMKSLITDRYFAIEEKFMPTRTEENYAQFVFLSNEIQPVLPEMDDRRFAIIEFQTKMSAQYYEDLANQIENGGAEAFYAYLLNYNCTGYKGKGAQPPMTEAKRNLMEISGAPAEIFLRDWQEGNTPFPYGPCVASELWNAYCVWCKLNGVVAGNQNMFGRYVTNMTQMEQHRVYVENKQVRVRMPSEWDHSKDIEACVKDFTQAYNETYLHYMAKVKL